MIVINVYEGFTSEIRAYFLAFRLAETFGDKFVLDLSQFYKGSYWNYHLDYLKIPEVEKFMCRCPTIEGIIDQIREKYQMNVANIQSGEELENIYNNYSRDIIYYISEDSYVYDYFFERHSEFFYRYVGNDWITAQLFDFLELRKSSDEYQTVIYEICSNTDSVGVHIRLGDFYNAGWIVDSDLAFYPAAIQMLREMLSHPMFYVFSDEPIKAKELLGIAEDIRYIHFECTVQSDIEELMCLAGCKNRILNKKSTYGLLAETIARNKYKEEGITVIIQKMNFTNDAGNKDYVDKLVNSNDGVNKDSLLGKYITLNVREIEEYHSRYKYCKPQNENQLLITSKKDSYEIPVVFFTRQNYSKSKLTGMQYWAHYLAYNRQVIFVGAKELAEPCVSLEELIEESNIENGMYQISSKVRLFSYNLLNNKNLYSEFIERVKEEYGYQNTIIICRKPNALPLKKDHKGNLYVFVDFTDPYEAESVKCIRELTQNDIIYMYENADLVITFSQKVKLEYETVNQVKYLDIKSIYPDCLVLSDNDNPEIIGDCCRNLCSRMSELLF